MWCLRAVWFIALAVAGVAASTSPAQDWGTMPTISSTMGVQANRLCLGEASRGDIGCPSYAPSVTTAGDVSITGSVSAAKFLGDGSALTGVTADATDRITSGTTSFIVISDTGYISLTQASTNTGWFDPTRGLVTLGVSATGTISGTDGYFSGNVGIGLAPSSQFSLWTSSNIKTNGTLTTSNGTAGAPSIYFAASAYTGLFGGTGNFLAFTTSGTEAMRIVSSGYVGIGTSAPSATLHVMSTNAVSAYSPSAAPTALFMLDRVNGAGTGGQYTSLRLGASSNYGPNIAVAYLSAIQPTNNSAATDLTFMLRKSGGAYAEAMRLSSSGTVAIGLTNPTTALEVSGTISATNFVGNGSGLTGLASGDRLVSGSVSAIAEQTSGTVRVSGTLALANSGNEACNASKHHSLRINPATGILQMCRP